MPETYNTNKWKTWEEVNGMGLTCSYSNKEKYVAVVCTIHRGDVRVYSCSHAEYVERAEWPTDGAHLRLMSTVDENQHYRCICSLLNSYDLIDTTPREIPEHILEQKEKEAAFIGNPGDELVKLLKGIDEHLVTLIDLGKDLRYGLSLLRKE